MNLYLPEYTFGNRMLVVARDQETYEECIGSGRDVMFIREGSILFQPGEYEYITDRVLPQRLALLCDSDIVEISDSGLLYRTFANNEGDTTIFLGAKCNSNCIMCPAGDEERRRGFSYSRDLLEKYIDYLPYDLDFIVITGGEPTMQTDVFLDVLDRVKEKYPDAKVLLLTNGRSLSNKWLCGEVMHRHPNHFRIAIPVHGSTPQIHDSITRVPGSFSQTMLALRRLMDSDIEIEIRLVVTKKNCDDLLQIAQRITSQFHRVACVNFVGLEPRGNCALNFNDVYIDHQTSFRKSVPAIRHLVSNGYDAGLYNYPLCALDEDYWPIAAKSIAGYKNVYHPDCEKCSVKPICGGFFTATMSIAKPKVFPILKEAAHE